MIGMWNYPKIGKRRVLNYLWIGDYQGEKLKYIKSELKIKKYFMDHIDNVSALRALCLLISYGTKG